MGQGYGSTMGSPAGAAHIVAPQLAQGTHRMLNAPFKGRPPGTQATPQQLGQSSSHYARQKANYDAALRKWTTGQ
jgi:hypothetical protein